MSEINCVHCGDNLSYLRCVGSGTIDLVVTDPPFNKGRDFKSSGGRFKDRWLWERDVESEWVNEIKSNCPGLWRVVETSGQLSGGSMSAYLCCLGVRLIEMRRALKPTGSIYLHCDATAVHYLKLVMDAVFGRENFRNEIVWRRQVPRGQKAYAKCLPFNSDYILLYSKSGQVIWNRIKAEQFITIKEAEKKYRKDEQGYYSTSDPGTYSNESLIKFHRQGRIYVTRGGKVRIEDGIFSVTCGTPRIKYYKERKGDKIKEEIVIDNIWDDIHGMGTVSGEYLGYPTQKPLALYKRIVIASSNEGDVVLDPFCGSGTTLVAAKQLGRRYIGVDISAEAVAICQQRLSEEMV